MSETEEWHVFDANLGYEVRALPDNRWAIRDRDCKEWELSAEEFEQLRTVGVNPQDIP